VPYENCVEIFQRKCREERYFQTQNGNESLPEIGNDNGVTVVNLKYEEVLWSRVQCFHIATFTNTLGLLLIRKHNQIVYALTRDDIQTLLMSDILEELTVALTIIWWLRKCDRDCQ
jgi:hypothetical protein